MIALSPELKSVINDDGAVILNGPRNQITTFDAMGGYIWRQLQQGRLEHEIVERIVLETGAARETVEADLTQFLEQLASQDLLTLKEM